MTRTIFRGEPKRQPTSARKHISTSNLSKVWGKGTGAHTALIGASIEIHEGELCAVVGPSGSGKSTLGALLAGIDKPTGGTISIGGTPIHSLNERRLTRWRAHHLGIVFQDFHLLPTLNVSENVSIALELSAMPKKRTAKIREALQTVGMASMSKRQPHELSGGEKQRVAIARAIVKDPTFVVADEPTGSLDQENGQHIFDLLQGLSRKGTTIVFITHDQDLAMRCDRTISIVDGKVETASSNTASVSSVKTERV